MDANPDTDTDLDMGAGAEPGEPADDGTGENTVSRSRIWREYSH